jgi:hypothetical protein
VEAAQRLEGEDVVCRLSLVESEERSAGGGRAREEVSLWPLRDAAAKGYLGASAVVAGAKSPTHIAN